MWPWFCIDVCCTGPAEPGLELPSMHMRSTFALSCLLCPGHSCAIRASLGVAVVLYRIDVCLHVLPNSDNVS